MKQQRIKCRECGDRFTYYRIGAGRPPIYCPGCAAERKTRLAVERVDAMRQRRRRQALRVEMD